MIGFAAVIEDLFGDVKQAAREGGYESLNHAAASVRKEAIASIETSKQPSAPGAPIHTRRGLAKRAIIYAVDKAAGLAVIGPRASAVGTSMVAHEFGGQYKRQEYPKRAFMGPALDRKRERLSGFWADSLKQK